MRSKRVSYFDKMLIKFSYDAYKTLGVAIAVPMHLQCSTVFLPIHRIGRTSVLTWKNIPALLLSTGV